MGMTKASLDLHIQQETQKAIAELQRNMKQLDKILQIVDGNMRQSHVVLFQDITQIRIRVNFLMNELKNKMTEEESNELEARFMEFARKEAEKIDLSISELIKKKEEEQEAQRKEDKDNIKNVVQQ